MTNKDNSDVAFVYWSGSRRRNKPDLKPNTSLWSDFAQGFSDAGVHVVGINNTDKTVKINIKKIIPPHIRYVIFQEIAWREWGTWGQPKLLNEQMLEGKVCGLLTTDYWETAWSNAVKDWMDRYPVFKQFVVTLHESSVGIFNVDKTPDNFKIYAEKNNDKNGEIKRTIGPCNMFERNIRSSFSINKDDILKHQKFDKKYDICVGGVVKYSNFYPLRKRLYDLIASSNKFSIINPLRGFDKKGYRNYYKAISQSRMSLSTSGGLRNSVKKYLEIPSLKSCIVGNLPLEFDFLENISCCLNEEMSDKEMLIKMDDFLHNLPSLEEASSHVLNYYNSDVVVSRMIERIKNAQRTA